MEISIKLKIVNKSFKRVKQIYKKDLLLFIFIKKIVLFFINFCISCKKNFRQITRFICTKKKHKIPSSTMIKVVTISKKNSLFGAHLFSFPKNYSTSITMS
ncbi:hypothetical protein EDEG_03984 [Edhazardia aedis USNM 41457]|uniref:Uncharacterized protein n=1 Tax=Edhazardia aedis (strain USNM 41457) TaxID=1003232 RepID=J9DFL2_EDHAE|nr:hypothetical protein EDEG_03984 [Edhazardia aedis USNM 41457]|eukprot:EJW01390.1 hypothetical protein EDEG_03984 [Edhazardia aedis USNM 41457]